MKLLKKLTKRKKETVDILDIDSEEDLLTAAASIDRHALVVNVPRELLIMQGGFIYDDDHPFVRALRYGLSDLENFYISNSPKTIIEYYGLPDDARLGAQLPPWEMPWHGRMERRPPPGECGLSADHGVSFYGPVTPEKLATEMARLTETLSSVNRHGFLPEEHGYIEGHALHAGPDTGVRFFVRGGKHRAAVMSYLGMDPIPVKFRPRLQRVVDINQSRAWPLVRQNKMDQSLAEDIFLTYFRKRPPLGGSDSTTGDRPA